MKIPTETDAEAIALKALAFLGSDPERLDSFFALSGLNVASLRAAAADPDFLRGVLDHLVGDDRLLLAFTADAGVAPDFVLRARAALSGPESFE